MAEPAWEILPPGGVEGRRFPQVVWTGTELIAWGGEIGDINAPRLTDDGAVYDPVKRTWRRLAPSPLRARAGAVTVWTGKEMLIWGGVEVRGPPGTQPSAGATPPGAYEPASDTWRTLPAGPLDVVAGAVGGWTGRELVIWGGVDGDQRGAAFEPCSNRWRSTAPAPIEPRDMVASVWTGRELLFWGGNTRTNFPLSDGAAYDPARDTWRVLPPVSVRGYYAPEPVWTGAEMLVWGWSNLALDRAAENETVAYNAATTQWRTVPRAPLVPPVDQYEGTLGGRVAWTGESLLAWSGTLDAEGPLVLELDPRTDQWKRLPLPPAASPLAPEIVWTGYELIVLGAGPDHSALAMRLSAR